MYLSISPLISISFYIMYMVALLFGAHTQDGFLVAQWYRIHPQCRRHMFNPRVWNISWRRKWPYSLQYSCLGNLMNRGVWWAIVHGVAKELDMS